MVAVKLGFLPSNSRILVKSGNHRPLWFCFHDTDLLLDLMPGAMTIVELINQMFLADGAKVGLALHMKHHPFVGRFLKTTLDFYVYR